jgi:DNA repair protein RecO (recombination protein O)
MLYKTRGIVLHTLKYSDHSIIANVYTEEFGRQSYMIKGAHKKKATVNANLFYPLNLLEMEVYHKQVSNLQQIKEARINPVYSQIIDNPQKKAVVVFLSEMLYRSLKEEIPNHNMFDFIFSSLQILDLKVKSIVDFHLVFLMQLTKFLGFYPLNNFSSHDAVFDLLHGRFVPNAPAHGHYIHIEESVIFSSLINKNYDNLNSLKLNRECRQYILEKMVEYYMLHIEGMGVVKSLQVLKEVFD